MSINIGPPAVEELRPHITVIGVGGAGGNAIANMITADVEGVDFIVANTDAQALNSSIAEHRIQLGPDITQGLGAGSRPEVGRAAAEETLEDIERSLEGVHMCFIAAGMGGGTGTGAAPVIAKAARDRGVLTVGVVTKPFLFEGTRRMRSAEAGIDELQRHVDTLIVIPNQNLFLVAKPETTFKEAFQLADEVLQQGVRSITDLMVMPGLINLDFADVRSVMGEMGKAMMGTGESEGPNRALEAAERAISNPLLDGVSMQGAKGVIISIIGGDDMKLLEVDEAANHIRELVDPNANIIWGSAFNPDLQGKIRVSVVATGIEQTAEQHEEASRPFAMTDARGPARPGVPAPARGIAPFPGRPPVGPRIPQPRLAEATPVAPEWNPEAREVAVATTFDDQGSEHNGADNGSAVAPEVHYAENGNGHALGETDTDGDPLDLQLELDEGRATAEVEEAPLPVAAAPRIPFRNGLRPANGEAQLGAAVGRGSEPAPPARLARGRGGLAISAPGSAPAKVGAGGTLFERMASLSRGGRPAVVAADDDDDAVDLHVPRFLSRQGNP